MPGANSAGELGVDVVPELKDFGGKLSSGLRSAVASASSSTTSAVGKLGSAIGNGLKTAAKVGGYALAGLTTAAVAFGKQSIDAWTESNTVNQQTIAGLKSTGAAAGVTLKQVGNLANTIRDYSGIEDEAIQSGENLLLTFTNIRNEAGKGNDIFNQATVAMANLSARMGQDTKSSAIQLGKALNDPVKGVTALRRVGVAFTQDQLDQIKALQESGDLMGAQKIILGELTKEFGGSAKAMGKANPAAILKSQIGDIQESFGKVVLPLATELLSALKPALTTLAPILAGFLKSLAPVLGQVLAALTPVVGILAGAFSTVLKSLGPVIVALAPSLAQIATVLAQILVALTPLLPALGNLLVALLPLVVPLLQIAAAIIGQIVPALTVVIGWITKVVAAITGWIASWLSAKTTIATVARVIVGVLTLGLSELVRLIVQNWNTIKSTTSTVWNAIKSAVITPFNAVKKFISDTLSTIKKTWGTVWNSLSDTVSGIWTGIVGAVKTGVNAVIEVINALIRGYNAIPFHGDIPTIPHLQHGTDDFGGGLAIVGEVGRELVELPEHSRVRSHPDTERALAGVGQGNTYNFNQVIPEPAEVIAALTWHELVRGF